MKNRRLPRIFKTAWIMIIHAPTAIRLFQTGQNQLHQLPIVVLTYLLGEKDTAGFENTKDFGRIKAAVAIEHQIKGVVGKGQGTVGGCSLEINAQRQENLFAQLHIGRIVFNGGGQMMRVMQRQQKFAAAGVHIQNPAVGAQRCQHFGFIIPGKNILVLPSSVQVGKIPAVDVGDGFFCQPLFSDRKSVV